MPEASARSGLGCSVDQIVENDSRRSPSPPAADPVATAARYASYSRHPGSIAAVASELVAALESARDPRVRAAALGALVRGRNRDRARRAWRAGAANAEPTVRRRAAELTPLVESVPDAPLRRLMEDPDHLVADAACFAAGEVTWTDRQRPRVVAGLLVAASHPDPLVRESAVAALGAVGDPRGLPAIIAGCKDRPTVRRRAVLALAPFDGPAVEAALQAALADSDWQTRQAAEDLLAPGDPVD